MASDCVTFGFSLEIIEKCIGAHWRTIRSGWVERVLSNGAYPHPDYQSWLMGFPLGWTTTAQWETPFAASSFIPSSQLSLRTLELILRSRSKTRGANSLWSEELDD